MCPHRATDRYWQQLSAWYALPALIFVISLFGYGQLLAGATRTTLSLLVTVGLVIVRRRVRPVMFSPAPYRP